LNNSSPPPIVNIKSLQLLKFFSTQEKSSFRAGFLSKKGCVAEKENFLLVHLFGAAFSLEKDAEKVVRKEKKEFLS